MAYISGEDYKLEIDTTGSEDWSEVDIISSDTNWGEVVDTFYKLNSHVANNKVVALDPEFSFTVKYDDGNVASEYLLTKRASNSRTIPIKITDPADDDGVEFTFNGELTAISDPRTIEEVISLDITIKVADGTITRTATSV